VVESKRLADTEALNNFEDLSDFPEVWQPKSLADKENRLGDGALSGRTGRGPSQPTCLHYTNFDTLVKDKIRHRTLGQ
jgi:hypothetical protein